MFGDHREALNVDDICHQNIEIIEQEVELVELLPFGQWRDCVSERAAREMFESPHTCC